MKVLFQNKRKEVNVESNVEKIAELITGHCTRIKKKDNVCLVTSHTDAQLLYEIVRKKIIQKGAIVYDHFVYGDYLDTYFTSRSFLKDASIEQLNYLPQFKLKEIKAMDVFIWIEATPNHCRFPVSGKRFSQWAKTLDPIGTEILKKRNIMTFFPTKDYAKLAKISLRELRKLYYDACLVDRKILSKEMNKIKKVFDGVKSVRIKGSHTDLTFSLNQRFGSMENGKENLPGGEVYYAPQENSLEGIITFSFPGIYFGKEIKNIRLKFNHGKIVSAKASKNQDILESIINTDHGSRFIGEFGIGCNFAVEKWVNEVFLSEVMLGTIHLAIGDSYKECKGTNKSAVHFDIVKDLRKEGEILINDKLVMKKGTWIF